MAEMMAKMAEANIEIPDGVEISSQEQEFEVPEFEEDEIDELSSSLNKTTVADDEL